MKKLLKNEVYGFCEQYTRTHWCTEKGGKSQTLQLLFMNSTWTVAVTVRFVSQTRDKKKKKKKEKRQMQTH